MEDTNYCKRCGLSISKDRKSNFCSDLCNLMPSNFNNQEATIYRDGYNKGKREERENIVKELPEGVKGSISTDLNSTKTSVAFRRGFNDCLKQTKSIISNK